METARVVLKKILQDPASRSKALVTLNMNHFGDRKHRYLFNIICKFDKGKIITPDMLTDIVDKRGGLKEKEMLIISEEIGAICSSRAILNPEFDYFLEALGREAETVHLLTGLEKAANAVSQSSLEEAQRILRETSEKIGCFEMRDDRCTSARTMRSLQPDTQGDRYLTGFKVLDEVTGGGRRGELWLWAAYAGEFKSMALLSLAHNSFLQGKNVLFVSLEMDETEVKRRLICLHSFYMKKPVRYRAVELGSFTSEESDNYAKAIKDFDTGKGYGDIQIFRPPFGVTIMDIAREVERTSSICDIEICIVDYIQLLLPVRKCQQRREEYTDSLQRAKRLAMEIKDRKGVWIVSGYQTSQEGRKRAEQQGYYDAWSLSETIGAIQTANVVAWSLYTKRMQQDKEVKVGLMKSRNTAIDGSIHYLAVDPSIGFMSKEPVRMVDDAINEAEVPFDLDALE